MRRTADSIQAAANATQLEMRILTSHGTDSRFAFLRGRWSVAWDAIKEESRKAILAKDKSAKQEVLGLAAYDSDSDVETGPAREVPDDGALKAARRARLKAWTEERRKAGT